MTTELIRYDLDDIDDRDLTIDRIGKLRWRTKEGELIALKDLSYLHLRNIALMLIGMSYQEYNAPNEIKIKWLIALHIEFVRRKRNDQKRSRKNSSFS